MSHSHDNAILTVCTEWPWLLDQFYIHCGDAGIHVPKHFYFDLDESISPGFYIYLAEYQPELDTYVKKAEFFGVPEEKLVSVLKSCSHFMKMVKHLEPTC